MSNILEQIRETGDHIAVVHPEQLAELHKYTEFITPPQMGEAVLDGKVGQIRKSNGALIDVYSSTVIKDDYVTYDFRDKIPPHLLHQWFDQIYEEILEKKKDKETGQKILSVYKDITLPDGEEITLDRRIEICPEEVKGTEIDLNNEAKQHLKHELQRIIDEAYYNDK